MSERQDPAAKPPYMQRRRLLIALIGLFLALGIGWTAYWFLVARFVESTDDAYVSGNVVQITPQVAGTVLAIHADDTDLVKTGQVLVELDRADARIALEQAEAALARSVRQVRNLIATGAELQANVALRELELERARADLARRAPLGATGAVPAEELQHARDAVASAQAALEATRRQLAAQRTLVDRTTVETHPEVLAAAARVREAYLADLRSAVPAPVSGIVAKRTVQVGQHVSAGTPLMAVIPLDQVWVDANFRERQLVNLRSGQKVKLHADVYGGDIEYHGQVVGFGAGTGSAFALLPPQNASGNWIKVAQRLPVRIALDPAELARHPLRIGLSMLVDVDTHEREGALAGASRPSPAYEAKAYARLGELADQRVAAIIRANTGVAGTTPRETEKPSRRDSPGG